MLVGPGAGAAFAGEVKGPPHQVDNTNETAALAHANSALRRERRERLRLDRPGRTDGVAGADSGGLVEVLLPSEGCPRQARTLQGRNRAEVRLGVGPGVRPGPAAPTRGPEAPSAERQPSDHARRLLLPPWMRSSSPRRCGRPQGTICGSEGGVTPDACSSSRASVVGAAAERSLLMGDQRSASVGAVQSLVRVLARRGREVVGLLAFAGLAR
jgi:hypothetical protein